ncbi:MAG: YaaA family protein [Candidatus Izemoplasmatales bacterium]|nr:YaaA family protein [Candidatus Izemoplasmatales bacterium]
MKIIISPSKTQNLKLTDSVSTKTVSLSMKTKNLFSILKKMEKEELGKFLKIKGKLLDETFFTYQKRQLDEQAIPAISCYQGVVFEQLQLDVYSARSRQYLNEHLRILSAMYGVLKPDTLIYPYRLDMTVKLPKINLYNFWQKTVIDEFNNEDFIINLASLEFSRMLQTAKVKMINIDFYDENKDSSLKIISYNSKKARGKMVNYLIMNQIYSLDGIKTFNEDGYLYSDSKSTQDNLVFIKRFE